VTLGFDYAGAATFVASIAGLVTAIATAIHGGRKGKRRDKIVESVARAAAKGPHKVREVVDELDRSGSFQRPQNLPPHDG
jgi:hypothetical protein